MISGEWRIMKINNDISARNVAGERQVNRHRGAASKLNQQTLTEDVTRHRGGRRNSARRWQRYDSLALAFSLAK